MDMEQRIERSIAALTDVQKAALIDKHVGPMMPGWKPDPEGDARYLRGIIEGQLKEADAKEASGLDALEKRVAKIERWMRDGLPKALVGVVTDCLRDELAGRGYMRHRGTWNGGIAYSKGNCVVCDGATWIALSDVEAGAKPGSALEWRLVVKSEGRP